MRTGHVVGRVWTTKKMDQLPAGALLEVQIDGDGAHREKLVAFDTLGCGEGERVLIATGSAAARHFRDSAVIVDAVVVGIVDSDA